MSGLIEGDGTFFVPKHFRNKSNKINYPFIQICFSIKDKCFVDLLLLNFGGNVYINKENTFIIWKIYKILDIINLVNLINGFLRTPKIFKLYELIDYLLKYFSHFLLDILVKKPLDNSLLDSNAWLSGFTDADGNFSLNISKRKKKKNWRIQLSFRLELQQNYQQNTEDKKFSFFFICSKIASFFNVSLYTRERYFNGKIFYSFLIVAHSLQSHRIVYDYFNKYNLFSSKYLDFKDWSEIYLMQLDKLHLTELGLKRCLFIKAKFNNKRLYITWDHLQNFYL